MRFQIWAVILRAPAGLAAEKLGEAANLGGLVAFLHLVAQPAVVRAWLVDTTAGTVQVLS